MSRDYHIAVSYEYDLWGNLVRKETGGESAESSRDYEYYVSGALRSVRDGGSGTFYYYGDEGLIYSDGATDNTYIRGIEGTVDAAYLGDDYSIYATDVQGSTWSLIGDILERDVSYTYSDFGETTVSGDTSNEICYTGAVRDAATGMYYMNARYYDPETGRFISQDTYRGEDDEAGT